MIHFEREIRSNLLRNTCCWQFGFKIRCYTLNFLVTSFRFFCKHIRELNVTFERIKAFVFHKLCLEIYYKRLKVLTIFRIWSYFQSSYYSLESSKNFTTSEMFYRITFTWKLFHFFHVSFCFISTYFCCCGLTFMLSWKML